MSETSHYLDLPYLMPSQAQKHVTHNEALRMLDALVQISVLGMHINDPPQEAAEGARYLVGDAPTGAWSGQAGKLTAYVDGSWMFLTPSVGWLVWNEAANGLQAFDGSTWQGIDGAAETVAMMGVNGEASDGERLVVQSGSVLFNHDGADLRLKLNKAGTDDVASIIFQSAYQGCVELGLAGDDGLSVRVSANGSSWNDAIRVDGETGLVGLPAGGLELSAGLFPNLLPDSGRFTKPENQHQLTDPIAQMPAYLSAYNGATISFPYQFIHNNNTYGGTRGTLHSDVSDLVVRIAGAGGLRYGPEFWIMQVNAGTGLASSFTIDNDTFHRQTMVDPSPRPERFTTGFFTRALTGKIALRPQSGMVRQILRDGDRVEYGTAGVVVTPADGWTYFEIQARRAVQSYEQNDLSISMTPSSSGYIALPRIIAGFVTIGGMTGIVPNDRLFQT